MSNISINDGECYMDSLKSNIVILNYNDWETTIKFVEKIREYKTLNNIIIVDNNSSDDSVNQFKESFANDSKIHICVSEKNKGYAAGNNIGIEYLKKLNSNDYLIISNPDVFIEDNTISYLMEKLNTTPDIGIIAPMMITQDADVYKISCWRAPTYKYDFLTAIPFFGKKWTSLLYYPVEYFDKEFIDVDVIPGSFFIVNKSLLIELNPIFDEETFLYCEERILCQKVRNLKYRLVIATTKNYQHFQNISIGKTFKKEISRQKLLYESKKIYYKKFYSNHRFRNMLLFLLLDFNIGIKTFLNFMRFKKI